jgi:hypothetical protein
MGCAKKLAIGRRRQIWQDAISPANEAAASVIFLSLAAASLSAAQLFTKNSIRAKSRRILHSGNLIHPRDAQAMK